MTCNAEMGPSEVRDFCKTDASGEKLLKAAVQQLHLSARAYHRVLKLARTIADLAGSAMSTRPRATAPPIASKFRLFIFVPSSLAVRRGKWKSVRRSTAE